LQRVNSLGLNKEQSEALCGYFGYEAAEAPPAAGKGPEEGVAEARNRRGSTESMSPANAEASRKSSTFAMTLGLTKNKTNKA
jgi:hypothetical protein